MKTRIAVGLCILSLVFFASPGVAQHFCDLRQSMILDGKSITSSPEMELAFALTATPTEFRLAQDVLRFEGVYGLFAQERTWEDARREAQEIAAATDFGRSATYAESYLLQGINSLGLEFYRDCLDGGSPHLVLWVERNEGVYLILRAIWVGNFDDPERAAAEPPIIAGGNILDMPDQWVKHELERIVIHRNSRDEDLFFSLTIGNQQASTLVVRDAPQVVWLTAPVSAASPMVMSTGGSANPGCIDAQAMQCIFTARPGGQFVAGSAAINDRFSSAPDRYTEEFEYRSSNQICATITQSTRACEITEHASGTLVALERYPTADQLRR